MATIFMPRNKSSIIRSSSANGRPSYPYPRSHTPLMIIPSSRPVLEHPEASSSRQNSYGNRRGREHEQRPRRRPPLNTAIPTIPESKSNESIMSHISRVSVNNNDKSENTLPSDAGCVIIENPTATAGIPRLTTSANIQSSSTSIDVSNNNVASTSSGSNRRRDKRANTMGTSNNLNDRTSTNSSAPLSPLMSVAHSVRSKLSKLTRIRSRSNSTERSNSIKTSQSFSGIRPTPKAKVPPKRIDENANRVIKSSSMDVKLSSNVPSTSKVVIPQNPEPLCSDDEPSICDNNNPKEPLYEKLKEVETLPLQSEVIVEECETNRTEKELPPAFSDNENLSLKLVNDEVTEKIQSPVSIHEEVHTVIKAERRSQIPLSVSFSMEPICVSPSPVVESPGDKENSLSSSIYKNMEDSIDSKNTSQTTRQVLHATNRQDGSTTTTTTTITTTTTVTKTVSGELEKKNDAMENQAKPKIPSIASYSKTERMKRSKSEDQPAQRRYIMTVKTPECLRRHKTFVIGESQPSTETERIIMESRKKVKRSNPIRSKSMEEKSAPKYILLTKTPLQLNEQHQKFVIGECQGKDQVSCKSAVKPVKTKKPKRSVSCEEPRAQERFILISKTPLMLRKHNTFVVGEADPKAEVDNAVTTMEALVSPKKQKKIRSLSPEEPRSPERYVMIAKTPLTTRKHHTFVVGEAEPKAEVDNAVATMEALVSPKKQKKVRSPSPEEPRSPERYVMIAKTPLTSRKHQSFVVEEADSKYQVEVSEKVEVQTICKESKKTKAIVRQRSTPEQSTVPRERFVLVTKTPLTLRRHNTFVIGERPRSPDVPWIEEGELTEPIATVGPLAHKARTKSEEPRKQFRVDDEDKPQERFILTSRTPLPLKKFTTFVVENKITDLPSSQSECTNLQRGRETTRVKKEKLKSSSTFTAADRSKSPYEEELKSPERFVMKATTPLALRKYNQFSIQEKKKSIDLPETTDDEDKGPRRRMKTSEMYCLTATTPLLTRKSPKEELPPDDDDIMKSSSLARDVSFSPERTTLFVMGRRSPAPIERRPDPSSLHLDGIQENSQSDRAERKMSVISGEMTSPEEEIPMDTQQTPSEDEGAEIHFPLRSICIRTSPIPEETFIRKDQRPPVFCAPSPPRAVLSSKSTSPIKTSESRPEISTSSSLSSTKELSKRERKLAAKADKKKEEKEKPAKVQLATRSLRSAGRMFAPSFFRRSERRLQKAAVPPKSMSFSSNRPAMDISFNSRRAPLAEFESTVVENSPLVENHPITFDKWNNSPWSRRRFADQAFAQTIKEESDGNGNFNSSSFDRSVGSPLLGRNHDQDKGLIDDEILDQPMLVGDTFSHSESMDRLSAVRHMEAFEAEKATLISIDRSLAEDVDSSAITGVTNSVIIPTTSVPAVPSTITRRSDNGNSRPAQSIITPFYTSNITSHSNLQCNLEQGLNEVKDIKDQLQKLRDIVEQESVRAEDETKESLIRENDALRRQLIEQDNIIKALKQQITLLKST